MEAQTLWPLPVNLHSHQIMKYSFYSLSKQITRENFIHCTQEPVEKLALTNSNDSTVCQVTLAE